MLDKNLNLLPNPPHPLPCPELMIGVQNLKEVILFLILPLVLFPTKLFKEPKDIQETELLPLLPPLPNPLEDSEITSLTIKLLKITGLELNSELLFT